MTVTFQGFPVAALDFYDRLEVENTKGFWEANRQTYHQAVRAPMLALAEVLEPEFGEATVFRPNRDVRFSTDKSPYKDHQGLFVPTSARMGWYVQIGADGLRAAGGFYASESDQVARYRAGVDDDVAGERLMAIVNTLLDNGFDIGGDVLATRPRGIRADHPRLELMRHRTLTASRDHGTPDWLQSGVAADRVREDWVALRPLIEWCDRHVGASEKAGRRR